MNQWGKFPSKKFKTVKQNNLNDPSPLTISKRPIYFFFRNYLDLAFANGAILMIELEINRAELMTV